jgi:AcrR family transcriptional regulator
VNQVEERAPVSRADLTREKILEAAEVVFARRGLSGTRVREIAEAAGVNVATLYIYFPSKEDMYEAVLESGVRPLVELMSEFAAGERGSRATELLFTRVMQHLGTRPYFSRLVYLEAISEGSHLPELVDRWLRPILEHALGEARRGTTSPPWEESLSPLVVTSFIHLTLGHFAIAPLFREFFGSDPLSDEWITQQTKFVATLIRQMFPQIAEAQQA